MATNSNIAIALNAAESAADLWDTRTELNVKQTAISSFFLLHKCHSQHRVQYWRDIFLFAPTWSLYVYTYVTVTKKAFPAFQRVRSNIRVSPDHFHVVQSGLVPRLTKNQVTLGSQCRLSDLDAVEGHWSGSSPTSSDEGAAPRRVRVGKESSKQFDSQSRKPDDNRQLNVVVYGIPECTKVNLENKDGSLIFETLQICSTNLQSLSPNQLLEIVDALVNSQILAPVLVQS